MCDANAHRHHAGGLPGIGRAVVDLVTSALAVSFAEI
jgi:hypothetical protein